MVQKLSGTRQSKTVNTKATVLTTAKSLPSPKCLVPQNPLNCQCPTWEFNDNMMERQMRKHLLSARNSQSRLYFAALQIPNACQCPDSRPETRYVFIRVSFGQIFIACIPVLYTASRQQKGQTSYSPFSLSPAKTRESSRRRTGRGLQGRE